MFTQRHAHLQTALLSALAVQLLLTTAGQSAAVTSETTPLSNASLDTTQLGNGGEEEPRVLHSHRSCGGEHDDYCGNDGKCMYPQDSDKPFCICTSSYGGPRCLLIQPALSLPEVERVIGITAGVFMLILLLAIITYCCACKRGTKSAPLIKSAPSATSV
ncbi:epigen [Brachyistius frenatus]|uniref:epigen n=1 Tax=Brachyistius frenatus TaxID=100188 RepID=UPI0037E757B2